MAASAGKKLSMLSSASVMSERGAEGGQRAEHRELLAVDRHELHRHEQQGGRVGDHRRVRRDAGVGRAPRRRAPGARRRATTASWRCSRTSRCSLNSARLRVRGASPSGCTPRRITLTGGSSRCAATPVGEERQGGGVGGDEVPQPVDDHGGVGLVPGEDHVERTAHRVHLGVVERALPVHRGVAGGHQERVALPQRHVEVLGEVEHQLAARLRPPVSTKLRWRADTAASFERSSWLSRRRCRQSRRRSPTPSGRRDRAHGATVPTARTAGRLPER